MPLHSGLGTLAIPTFQQDVILAHYTDDIILVRPEVQEVMSTMDALVIHLRVGCETLVCQRVGNKVLKYTGLSCLYFKSSPPH